MENLNNLPPFYVGQKVIYINNAVLPKNSIHSINEMLLMPCGCYALKINTSHGLQAIGGYMCCKKCNTPVNLGKDYSYWYMASSFRPFKEQSFPLIKLSKVLEKELVSAN